MSTQVSSRLGIDIAVLDGSCPLHLVFVAKRMAWAAERQTTRLEDIAYCLLGIFGINMPLLYEEGSRACMRLQEEIMKETTDLSLFAWIMDKEESSAVSYRRRYANDWRHGLGKEYLSTPSKARCAIARALQHTIRYLQLGRLLVGARLMDFLCGIQPGPDPD